MTDIVDAAARSSLMARIGHADTKPELVVRTWLHCKGFRFRLHDPRLPGRPDLVLPKHKVCIFVNGCFWHHHPGCMHARIPATQTGFWLEKFARNSARDALVQSELARLGWRVVVIWECGIRDQREPDLDWLKDAILNQNEGTVVWPATPRRKLNAGAPRTTGTC